MALVLALATPAFAQDAPIPTPADEPTTEPPAETPSGEDARETEAPKEPVSTQTLVREPEPAPAVDTPVVAVEEDTATDAQDDGTASEDERSAEQIMYDDIEEVLVTATARASATRFQSSVSVSDITEEEVRDVGARTTTELYKQIPGIRAESTGGDNNANIQVRGIPVTTGGSKFVSLQEDGLPVLSFGDITFANADNFLRADSSLSRIEVVRGGSASTFASNGPGAVINFVSRTGEEKGGVVGLTRGIDFDTTRADFGYGAPIGNGMHFYVGGFYRAGEGARRAGFLAENGGQLKANLTKKFDDGYVRLYFKHLNDRTISYLPMPMRFDGTRFSPFDDFDNRSDALASNNLTSSTRVDNGERTDVRDGVHARSTAVGAEFQFELPAGWVLTNRGRFSATNGSFTGAFAAGVVGAADAPSAIFNAKNNGVDGASLVYANGANVGQAVGGNSLLVNNLLFDVLTPNLNQFANDLQLTKSFDLGGAGMFDVTAGYYKSIQNVETQWSFNFFLQELQGDNAALVDVLDAKGNALTANGVYDYGNFDPLFDLTFERDAAYGALVWNKDWFTLDGSLRYENVRARGSSNLGSPSDGVGGFESQDIDVNGDGAIVPAEQGIGVVDPSNQFAIRYGVDYLAFSVGANAEINKDFAAFARVSRGGVANGDRLVLGGNGFTAGGDLLDDGIGVDITQQLEGGVKLRQLDGFLPGYLGVFLTGFYADTEESNFDITTGQAFDRRNVAWGAELEAAYRVGGFAITGGATFTDARIREDNLNPDVVGNRPQRQAAVVYQVAPSFSILDHSFGANIVGTTRSFANDINDLVMPGYAQVNLFANVALAQGLSVSANVANVFNTWGVSELQEASLPENGIVRGRVINGRTSSVTLRYAF